MSEIIEEIETITVKNTLFPLLRFHYVESEGYITRLCTGSYDEPIIVNGTPCVYERKFSKKSFDNILFNIKKDNL